ncbi:MAG: ABC transporter permease, partial [bacterium]|nr:ABC transporter permease [bacterium]
VAQKFSLYADLSVRENLKFFGGAYGLVGARLRDRIAWAEREFRLGAYMRRDAGDVPLGIKQHLAMAAALLHEPEILFLDEATSGAAIARAYQNAIGQALRLPVRGDAEFRTVRPPQVRARMWFNNANRSAWFLIPGVIVLVMAIIGCMLTSMQMAKEYEHGTIESLFATLVTAGEILVSKLVSNYLLGMVGLAISLVFSRYLFHVPMLGSLGWVVAGASLFILSQMGLGLVISSLTKSQFLSAQVSMIVSFLPVFLLSGFLYEIPNMPKPLQTLTALLPARYFVEFLQTAFLVGDVPTVYVRDLLPLVGFTVVFLVIAKLLNPKRAQGGNG